MLRVYKLNNRNPFNFYSQLFKSIARTQSLVPSVIKKQQ